MLRFASILLVLLLAGCSGFSVPVPTAGDSSLAASVPPWPDAASTPLESGSGIEYEPSPPPSSQAPSAPSGPRVYASEYGSLPSLAMSPEETLYTYFDLHYSSYASLVPADMSRVLDLENGNMYNLNIWLDKLIQRRRLIEEMDLCYVEEQILPYSIRILEEDELSDPRMSFWRGYNFDDDAEVWLHFVVEGQAGHAYPPLLALNSEHSVRMRRDGDGWKITFHYFPGARRKFFNVGWLKQEDDDSVRTALALEFRRILDEQPAPPPGADNTYNGSQAAGYAANYTEAHNPDYYRIDDWMGNCANFISQCVMYGFADSPDASPFEAQRAMTSIWYSGGGGGSPAWENVGYFWSFATGDGPMHSLILDSVSQLRDGDIVQTRSLWSAEDSGRYNHSLIVADQATLKLGQNSPSCFVYYSDLPGVEARLLRPLYLD